MLIPNKFLVLACCIGALQAILTEYKTTDRMSRQSKYDKAGQFHKADFKSHMPVQTVPIRHWNIKSDDLFIEPNKLISLPYFFLQPTRKYIQQHCYDPNWTSGLSPNGKLNLEFKSSKKYVILVNNGNDTTVSMSRFVASQKTCLREMSLPPK